MDPQANGRPVEHSRTPDGTASAGGGRNRRSALRPASEATLDHLEQERLAALHSLAILDTQAEQQYDDLTSLASYICNTPMALISFVDKDRQWFKSKVGIPLTGTPRSESICAYTIRQPGLFIVEDATRDERFAGMPLVTGGVFRFYAGAPIQTADGHSVGSLCVLDEKPRELTEEQKTALLVLGRSTTAYLLIRGQVQELLKNAGERCEIEQQLRQSHVLLQEANRQLEQLAATDSLTGLPNRRVLEACLYEQQQGGCAAGQPLSLLMIDVDHFKRVNDTYSHEAGDGVLKRVAEVLRASTRGSDTVARYGGEEFVVLLRGSAHGAALIQAERVRAAIAGDAKAVIPVTVSIGVATVASEDWNLEVPMLLTEADRALYAAKHDGRNCVRSAQPIAQAVDQVPA